MNTDYELLLSDIKIELGEPAATAVAGILSRHAACRISIPADPLRGRKIAEARELIESGRSSTETMVIIKARHNLTRHQAYRIVRAARDGDDDE